jgi:hypothetical protein
MRVYDANFVNAIADRCEDRLGEFRDFTIPISNQSNIFLHDLGIAACIWSAPEVYECHLLYPPEFRGRAAIAASKRMADFMMNNHAKMLWGQPPSHDAAACWHIRQVGFDFVGFGHHAVVGDVSYFRKVAPCLQL